MFAEQATTEEIAEVLRSLMQHKTDYQFTVRHGVTVERDGNALTVVADGERFTVTVQKG